MIPYISTNRKSYSLHSCIDGQEIEKSAENPPPSFFLFLFQEGLKKETHQHIQDFQLSLSHLESECHRQSPFLVSLSSSNMRRRRVKRGEKQLNSKEEDVTWI